MRLDHLSYRCARRLRQPRHQPLRQARSQARSLPARRARHGPYVDKKAWQACRELIDANGNYITQTIGGKHIDHGTAMMKDGKACFTSAMTKDGEMCWTTHPVKIGHSFVTTNDKGRKLKVTRVAYAQLSMPEIRGGRA